MNELAPYLKMLRQYRGRLSIGAVLMFVTSASGIGLLALSGWFITATAVTGALIAAGVAATLEIYIPGGGIRTFAVSRTVARYFERIFNHDTVLQLLRDLRGRVFTLLSRLNPAEMARLRSGELLTASPPISTAWTACTCADSHHRSSHCWRFCWLVLCSPLGLHGWGQWSLSC